MQRAEGWLSFPAEDAAAEEEAWAAGDGGARIGPAHLIGWEEVRAEVEGAFRERRLLSGASAVLPVARRAHQQWGVAAIEVPPGRPREWPVDAPPVARPPRWPGALEEERAGAAAPMETDGGAGARASLAPLPHAGDGESAYRPLTEAEQGHVTWMLAWVEQQRSAPGNAFASRPLDAQVAAALAARNQALSAADELVSASFLPLARAYLFGAGPLDAFLRQPGVTDLVVNGTRTTCVRQGGRWYQVGPGLASAEITNIVAQMTGEHLNQGNPSVEASARDGSRVTAVYAGLTRGETVLAIRTFPAAFTCAQLVARQMLTAEAAAFLAAAIRARLSLAIAGGAGTGKTTLLNALCGVIPGSERLLVVEQGVREIRCPQPNVTYLETRKGTLDSKLAGLDAEISATWLVERALRLAPDRIIVGECRGVEVLAWLEAVNTGHAGSLTTLHSDQGALAAIRRLEGLVLRAASGWPQREVRRQIASAIQLLVYTAQAEGQRYVRDIVQLVPSASATDGFASSALFEARPEVGQPLSRTGDPLDAELARYFATAGLPPMQAHA